MPFGAFGGGKPPRGTVRYHNVFHYYFRTALYIGILRSLHNWSAVEPPSTADFSSSTSDAL